MMKSFLIALLGVGIFVGICNAACFFKLPEANVDGDPGGARGQSRVENTYYKGKSVLKLKRSQRCMHDGEIHGYGSSWRTKDCLDCDCYDDGGMRCCSNFGRPVAYNKVKCEEIFDQETCLYRVVRKDNPKKTCKHAMVG